jgi:hypothetical protein
MQHQGWQGYQSPELVVKPMLSSAMAYTFEPTEVKPDRQSFCRQDGLDASMLNSRRVSSEHWQAGPISWFAAE